MDLAKWLTIALAIAAVTMIVGTVIGLLTVASGVSGTLGDMWAATASPGGEWDASVFITSTFPAVGVLISQVAGILVQAVLGVLAGVVLLKVAS